MQMTGSLEVFTDRRGRIEHYTHPEFPRQNIAPSIAGGLAEDDQMLFLDGQEYRVSEQGGLYHPEVEIPEGVSLGSGVRLDKGTEFLPPSEGADYSISIGDRTRIRGTQINDLVTIGTHSVIKARSIGSGSKIGDHVLIYGGAVIQSNVTIHNSAKVEDNARICAGAVLEEVAKVGPAVVVGPNAVVSGRQRVGIHGRSRHKEHAYGGPYIPPGSVVDEDRIS